MKGEFDQKRFYTYAWGYAASGLFFNQVLPLDVVTAAWVPIILSACCAYVIERD